MTKHSSALWVTLGLFTGLLAIGFTNCSGGFKARQFASMSSSGVGTGVGLSSTTPDQTLLSLTGLAAYQSAVSSGGVYTVGANLPYEGGLLSAQTNYIYSLTQAQQNLVCGSMHTELGQYASLSPGLATLRAVPRRYLSGGVIVRQSATLAARTQCNSTGDGVQFDYLAADNQTVLYSVIRQNFAQIPLSGMLENSPSELLNAVPLDDWLDANYLVVNARWSATAAYLKFETRIHGDSLQVQDCNTTQAASSSGAVACATGKLEQFFPFTSTDSNGHVIDFFNLGDGVISTRFGTRVWISRQPQLGTSVTSFRAYFEMPDGIYEGLFQPDLASVLSVLADGSISKLSYWLNQPAVSVIQNSFIQGSMKGTLANSTAPNGANVDLFGIGGRGPNGALAPADLAAHYQVPAGLTGANQTVAIVIGPTYADLASEVNAMSDYYKLPRLSSDCTNTPCLQIIDLSDGTLNATSDWGVEPSLDLQAVHAMAPKANIVLVVSASHLFSDLTTAISRAASVPGVSVVSMSFGGTGGVADLDAIAQANPQVVFLAAAGDGGSQAQTPADLPYVTAVGGTTIHSVAGTGSASETAWSFSGGGPDPFLAMPDFQLSFLSAAQIAANGSQRAIPDVGAVADFKVSPFAVYYEQRWAPTGGTSLSAPLWAGMVALIGESFAAQGQSLGDKIVQANPGGGGFNSLLYATKAASTMGQLNSPFYEILTGSNNVSKLPCAYCSAQAGYNDITGLGAPNLSALIPALMAN